MCPLSLMFAGEADKVPLPFIYCYLDLGRNWLLSPLVLGWIRGSRLPSKE